MNPLNYMRLHDPSSGNPRQYCTNASNGKTRQVFLSRYSEHGNRLKALEQAGLKVDDPDLNTAKANAILAKISLLPMSDVLSAIGGDKILYLAGLLSAFQAPDEPQNWRTAATLLGKIHGLWDQGETGKGQTILVINAPTCPSCGHEHAQTTNGVPFAIPTEVTNRRALEMSANE
jgi:hypothetical protein